ncbi:DUF3611 family protein [Anabaena cylindrica FACHB-243]|uniref:DUF3611 family protein n=1 Tax=Anabaena cylindrica (strain ATCC 27899 / PCC 7122) TaxID=272123 RepID=K9ZB69_ANACC|nr:MULTISPECIES: DUF3611 family protein [Anabaena]AFZ56426.1 hypothetical protein Anacy_0848 [Anabaena cylindrica PCC 7122]MBD2418123.1 DUF3611 family protein [Anabaena cylindrica FACHB-243]MBY5281969.1 DUF3611 family protein [Anabaena sp. CCAP 1446/1C]MBY5311226.1 DUF3611 family protein [Anabaena sp. CCAP 1446/1C]MCM2407401.1 DUF3611 family protein [Anabaena sp. CCAP 1446/1C]
MHTDETEKRSHEVEPEVRSHNQDQASLELKPKVQDIAKTIRLTGWITFWIQLALSMVCGLALLFTVTGRDFAQQQNTGLGVGIFWCGWGIVVLFFSIFWNFRYTRFGKRLANPNPTLHPSKAETVRAIRLGVMVGLIGMLLSIFGAGATVSVLVAKSVSQPPGVAITDPYRIIRAMDVFVAVANVNAIAAHFVGTVGSIFLLERVHQH